MLLVKHEGSEIGIIPEGSYPTQSFYDNFFRTAREIDWLEF